MSEIQFDDQHPSEMTSSQTVEAPQETTGTKIGKVSDFEKDLIESEVIESAASRTKDDSFDMLEDEFEKHLSQDLEEFKEGDIVKARYE